MQYNMVWDQLPRYFFVTSGIGFSRVSGLNAFDEALIKAGIGQCNLVPVSSIIPGNAIEVDYVEITPGSVVFTVMSRIDGSSGEEISAGLAWGFGVRSDGLRYGLVVEAYGRVPGSVVKSMLRDRIEAMAKARGMRLENVKYRVEHVDRVPSGMYASIVVALVFVPAIDYDKTSTATRGSLSS